MIVDTSALIAVVSHERHATQLRAALNDNLAVITSPVLVEYRRVVWSRDFEVRRISEAYLQILFRSTLTARPFTPDEAEIASEANKRFGKGHGGKLNLLDLMVYATAKHTGLPILCTGNDFDDTDVDVHPASRRD